MGLIRSESRPFIAFIAVEAVVLLIAGRLALAGLGEAGVKLALFAVMVPGVVIMTVLFVVAVRTLEFWREPLAITTALFSGGVVLVMVPLLIYLPWSPTRWYIDQMPPPLAASVIVGSIAVTIGAVLGMGLRGIDEWRAGHRVMGVVAVFLAIAIPAILVIRRMGG